MRSLFPLAGSTLSGKTINENDGSNRKSGLYNAPEQERQNTLQECISWADGKSEPYPTKTQAYNMAQQHGYEGKFQVFCVPATGKE